MTAKEIAELGEVMLKEPPYLLIMINTGEWNKMTVSPVRHWYGISKSQKKGFLGASGSTIPDKEILKQWELFKSHYKE